MTATLPTDVTLYVRVGSRVGGIWRYSASIPFTAARMTATMIYPTANATGVVTTHAFEWTPVPAADAYILHIGTAPNTWNVLAAGLLTEHVLHGHHNTAARLHAIRARRRARRRRLAVEHQRAVHGRTVGAPDTAFRLKAEATLPLIAGLPASAPHICVASGIQSCVDVNHSACASAFRRKAAAVGQSRRLHADPSA